MKTTTYGHYLIFTFEDPLFTTDAVLIAEDILIKLIDMSAFTGLSVNLITAMVEPNDVRQINYEIQGSSSTEIVKHQYIELNAAEKALKSASLDSSILKAFVRVKRKIKKQLRPSRFHLRCGNQISSLFLYSTLGEDSGLLPWMEEVADVNPVATIGTGFDRGCDFQEDFPVPLNLVEDIAMQKRTLGGMLLMHALIESNYFGSSLVGERFHVSLGGHQGMILPDFGVTSATKLYEFLNPTESYAVWLFDGTKDMNLDPESDFICYSKKGFKILGGLDSDAITYLSPWLTKFIILSNQLPKTANQIFARLYFSGGNLASLMATHSKVLCQNDDSPF